MRQRFSTSILRKPVLTVYRHIVETAITSIQQRIRPAFQYAEVAYLLLFHSLHLLQWLCYPQFGTRRRNRLSQTVDKGTANPNHGLQHSVRSEADNPNNANTSPRSFHSVP